MNASPDENNQHQEQPALPPATPPAMPTTTPWAAPDTALPALPPSPPAPPEPSGGRTGCLGRLVELALLALVGLVVWSAQLWSYIGPALDPDVNPVFQTVSQAIVLLTLLALFAAFWRGTRERAIYRLWLLAALYPLLLAATRLFPPTASATVHVLQLGLTALLAIVLRLWLGRAALPTGTAPGWMWGVTLAAAGLLWLPWLGGGALGSLGDTLITLALGLAFGAVAALLMAQTWLPSLAQDTRGRGADITTGGLAAAGALLILASGLSFNGLQLVLMLALPLLGFLAAALFYAPAGPAGLPTYDWQPPAVLVGLVTAAILMLVDTDTMAVEAADPVATWAFRSALVCLGLAGVLAVAALLWRRQWGQVATRPGVGRTALVVAAATWFVALVVYAFTGNPGFYGDRYFVVLKSQADVTSAAQMDDYDARRTYVYTTLVANAEQSQAGLRQALDRFAPLGVTYTPYYLVNALEVDGGLLARLALLGRPEVDRILPSPRLRPAPDRLTVERGEPALPPDHAWNLDLVGAPQVWDEFGARGQGIVIGQSDSGVQGDHPELAPSYRGAQTGSDDYAWFDPWSNTPIPVDFGGHGTHTLGTIVGANTGVAPDATWIGCVNLQRNLGNPAVYLDCMQFMLAPFPLGGDPFQDGDPLQSANVLNNSWGCPQDFEGCDPASLRPAVDALRAAGLFVVASAGNSGPRCSTVTDPLAIYDGAFSVGAVDRNRKLAPFSSTGPVTADGSNRLKPDIAAPGMAVWSALPDSTYGELDGTSMAGPHVAGVVALLWSANPDLIGDIDATEQLLRETARPFAWALAPYLAPDAPNASAGEPPAEDVLTQLQASAGTCLIQTPSQQAPNNLVGYGVVDAYAAVERALR